MFIPNDYGNDNWFRFSILYRPTILDNEDALHVSENDEHEHIFFVGYEEEEEEKDATKETKGELDYFNH